MLKSESRTGRFNAGKAFRRQVPREIHGEFSKELTRDAVAILAQSDQERVRVLIPERYKRMTASPFAFLRGAAAVMATDLIDHPSVGISVQAGGDCHLMNFGAFATPEDNILFDVNDFDETLPGIDFTIDIKRLAASVAVAALNANLSRKTTRAMVCSTVAAYRLHMSELAMLSPLEIWHSRIDLEQEANSIPNKRLRQVLRKIISKARGTGLDTDDNFPNLVRGGGAQIADKPPTIFHLDHCVGSETAFDIVQVFEQYRKNLPPDRLQLLERYHLKDLAFKAVGVGSVGTFCGVALFMSGDGEPLFLQVKQAQKSVLERLQPDLTYRRHQGRRVINGQRIMQAATDIFLGDSQDHSSGREFYIRTLKNRRLGGISDIAEVEALSDYGSLCGKTLARAHARSGDPAMITGYLGKAAVFDDALARFAMIYAQQTSKDHAALVKKMDPFPKSADVHTLKIGR